MKRCAKCGNLTRSKKPRCPECGEKLGEDSRPASSSRVAAIIARVRDLPTLRGLETEDAQVLVDEIVKLQSVLRSFADCAESHDWVGPAGIMDAMIATARKYLPENAELRDAGEGVE
jgi:hypothetical protein